MQVVLVFFIYPSKDFCSHPNTVVVSGIITHHHTLKLSVELLKLGGEFLPGKNRRSQFSTLATVEHTQASLKKF